MRGGEHPGNVRRGIIFCGIEKALRMTSWRALRRLAVYTRLKRIVKIKLQKRATMITATGTSVLYRAITHASMARKPPESEKGKTLSIRIKKSSSLLR